MWRRPWRRVLRRRQPWGGGGAPVRLAVSVTTRAPAASRPGASNASKSAGQGSSAYGGSANTNPNGAPRARCGCRAFPITTRPRSRRSNRSRFPTDHRGRAAAALDEAGVRGAPAQGLDAKCAGAGVEVPARAPAAGLAAHRISQPARGPSWVVRPGGTRSRRPRCTPAVTVRPRPRAATPSSIPLVAFQQPRHRRGQPGVLRGRPASGPCGSAPRRPMRAA